MNWLHTLWFGYFWSSTKGNGPENLLAVAVGVFAGRLIWPKVKRHISLIHAKLDHIIEHSSDIPDFPGAK